MYAAPRNSRTALQTFSTEIRRTTWSRHRTLPSATPSAVSTPEAPTT